jgi:3-hydroxyisobutyrate dehydrogenase-like beta-hydroxyacid dehydrogenase
MLLGGQQAAALAGVLCGWGMDARAVSEELGVASAIKMCRSVMIKGLEALVIESYATARAYGVGDAIMFVDPSEESSVRAIERFVDVVFPRAVLPGFQYNNPPRHPAPAARGSSFGGPRGRSAGGRHRPGGPRHRSH